MPSLRLSPIALASMVLALAACGGGGSSNNSNTDNPAPVPPASNNLSGTAATGAAISGSVVVIDAQGKRSSAVATDASTGAFTVDVSGLKAPYLLQVVGTAGGRQVFLSSLATAAGQTVNITPLTDLIVSAAAGSTGGGEAVDRCAATAGANAPAACVSMLTQAASGTRLADATAKVVQMIAPLNPGVDPLTGSFKADGTGMDAVLDKLLVTPATSGQPQATVTLIASRTDIGSLDLSAATPSLSVTPPTGTQAQQAAGAALALPEIQACMTAFNALYPTSGFTMPSASRVAEFFDDGFDAYNISKSEIVSALTDAQAFGTPGPKISVLGLAAYALDPFSASETAALQSGVKSVLKARANGGAPLVYDAEGKVSAAWVVVGLVDDTDWKLAKGSAYSGCPGGWRLVGTRRSAMHMNARISRTGSGNSAVIDRWRAVHIQVDEVDLVASKRGSGQVDRVEVRGPGLAVYSGNPSAPVGADQLLTLGRPSDPLQTAFNVGDGNTWYQGREALASCADVAAAGAPAGTPCVDESRVVPGAVYAWTLKSGDTVVESFPYEVLAVPLSKAFALANQNDLFATIQSVTPATVSATRAAILATSAAVLDDLFSVTYTQGSAYGSRADNCFMQWRDTSNALAMEVEVGATGHETGCTFNSSHLDSGSLARPASPATLASGVLSVATQVLGNSAETLFTWP